MDAGGDTAGGEKSFHRSAASRLAAVGNKCMFQNSRYCQYSHEKEMTHI